MPQHHQWDVTSATHLHALDEYRESFEGLYEISDIDLGPHAQFANRTRLTLFQTGVIGHGQSNTQTLRRSAPSVRRAGFESLSIILANSRVVGNVGDRSVSHAPGAVMLVDLSRPSESHWTDLDLVNLVIPRQIAPAWLMDQDIHGMSLAPDSAAGRLIASHLRTFSDVAADLSEAEGEAAIIAALALAERALGRTRPLSLDQTAALYRTVRQAAGHYLAAHILDPSLSVDRIAHSCAVSRATLYRAFETEGGLMRHVQSMRLTLAHEALARRIDGKPTIADIADAHGFASAGHFTRVFRQRFGCAPSDVAPRARSGHTPAAQSAIRHRAVVDWLTRTRGN